MRTEEIDLLELEFDTVDFELDQLERARPYTLEQVENGLATTL